MARSSLEMYPSGYSAGKLYSQRPTNGVGDFTVDRDCEASRVNKDGIIEFVANNVPRLDYSDGGCQVLLTEPQSENSVINSEPTVNEGSAAGVTYEIFNWANGFTNCTRFSSNDTYRYAGVCVFNVPNTISVFVIMDDLSKPSSIGTGSDSDFRLIIGGSGDEDNVKYKYFGNNIWRVSMTHTPTSSDGSNGIVKYTGNTTKGFRVVGWQLEQSSFPTSYIKTEGSSVVRLADKITDAGDVTTFNSEEGVFYFEVKGLINGDNGIIEVNDGTANNRFYMHMRQDGDKIQFVTRVNSVLSFNATPSGLVTTELMRIAFKYRLNDVSIYINEVEVGSSSTWNPWLSDTLDRLNFSTYDYKFNLKAKLSKSIIYKSIAEAQINLPYIS